MFNGTGKALISFIYPIKHLNQPFSRYEFFLNNTILLVSTLWILDGFLFLWNAFLLIHYLSKIKTFFPFLYHVKKKR